MTEKIPYHDRRNVHNKGKKNEHRDYVPGPFGSHSTMIDEALTADLGKSGHVVLVDEQGPYTTEANRLNTGLADPNRYSGRGR